MQKSHLYSLLLFICSITACKKEEVNNPDIEDITLDLTIETTEPTGTAFYDLFIDAEVLQDFQFVIAHPNVDPNQHLVDVRIYDSKYEILNESIIPGFPFVKSKERNEFIKPSDVAWPGSLLILYCDFKDGATNYKFGSSDIGDQYIAFRKKNSGGGYFYGWMKINIINGEKLEIKEYALHKIADTPIKAGEK